MALVNYSLYEYKYLLLKYIHKF
ncbi:MAG: hypothetical protein LZF86_220024 [Nitrospira sp.]|nr:MAG: hypothetical protein LZF86_220024 [Nitrospira sp.]